jgi:hypothetical protein
MSKTKRNTVLMALLSLVVAFVFSGCGESGSVSSPAPQETSLPDLTAPQAPGILNNPRVTSGSTLLRWRNSPDSDVAGYNVYRYNPDPNRNTAYLKMNSSLVTGTQYQVSGLQPGVTYYYRITARDSAGNESVYSEAITACQPDGSVAPDNPKIANTAG